MHRAGPIGVVGLLLVLCRKEDCPALAEHSSEEFKRSPDEGRDEGREGGRDEGREGGRDEGRDGGRASRENIRASGFSPRSWQLVSTSLNATSCVLTPSPPCRTHAVLSTLQ